MRHDRVRSYRHGHLAEAAAAAFLLAKGYRLLARRYRTPLGEVDLIVRRGRTVAFVEVKARKTFAEAIEAVGPATERRVAAAADLWLMRHPRAAGLTLRFDVVLIVPWRLPRHLADAFRPSW